MIPFLYRLYELLLHAWQVPILTLPSLSAMHITTFGCIHAIGTRRHGVHDKLRAYKVLPFGLVNAPATFQRLMNAIIEKIGACRLSRVTHQLTQMICIILFYTEWQTHLDNIRNTLPILRQYGIYLGIKKCCFGVGEIPFLGFRSTCNSITIDPKRTKTLQQLLYCTITHKCE